MLLANSSVSGKAATGHVLMYAPTGGFPRILALHPKSLRQIGELWFSERTPEVLTNLSWEVRFFEGNGEGIEALAKPIFVRGVGPFNGWRPVPPSLFIQNHYAKSGTFGFFKRTPEELTNLSWEVRFF